MTLHANTALSFRQLNAADRRTAVLAVFARGAHLTDRDVARILGFQDMNGVRPTITHLTRSGQLVEDGTALCGTTKRTVRLCRLRRDTDPAPSFDRTIAIGPKAAALLDSLVTGGDNTTRNVIFRALTLYAHQQASL